MYLEHYGLVEKPFGLTPDPKYFFASGCHAEARDLLRYGVREREGLMCLFGGPGTGKTVLLRSVIDGFGDDVVTALVLNPFLSEEDLLRTVLVDLGAATRQQMDSDQERRYSEQMLGDRLNERLMLLSTQGKVAVLVIDEAQNLPMPVMQQIRRLSNLVTAKAKLLQIVLAGQLGLRELLLAPELGQLAQRVSVRYTLQPLTAEEVGRYIEHRLRIAGSDGSLAIDRSAVERIFRYSEGVPRLVNLIGDRALLAGYAQRTSRITAAIVDRAAETLDLAAPGVTPPVERHLDAPVRRQLPRTFRATHVIAAGVAIVVLMVAGLWMLGGRSGSIESTSPARTEGGDSVPGGGGAGVPSNDPWQPPGAGPITPGGSYTIYLSSFRRADDERLVTLRQRLYHAGYRSYVVSAEVPGEGALYRLLAGDFADLVSAESASARLRRELGIAQADAVAVADVIGS